MELTQLQPRQKKAPLLKARSGGWFEKILVIGGGACIVYSAAATAPIAAGAAILAMAAYLWEEAKGFQSRELSEQLDAILNAKTPRHPSINELRTELKRKYPVNAINSAIESMLGYCEIVHFKASDTHPLAVFGCVFCWVNPDDSSDVKLPLQRMEQLFALWGIIATQETQAIAIGQESSVPALPASVPPHTSGNDHLIERLLLECPELLKLVKAPPIRCVGAQRTGKTTLAKILGLLRLLLLPGHQVIAVAPHVEAVNSYPSQFKRVGITANQRDYPAIAAEWQDLAEQIYRCEVLSRTHIWDEFGTYGDVMSEEQLTNGLTSTLREATKHGSHPIFILHGETLAFMPGGKGLSSVILRGTVRVEAICESMPPFGEMRPTGKFTVQWLDGSNSEGQIPAWLTEKFLLDLLAGKAEVPAPTDTPNNPQPEPEPITKLQPEATQLQADSEVATASHEAVEAEAETETDNRYQIVRRVGLKIAEKLALANGDWVSVSTLVRDTFSQSQDREVARAIIKTGIEQGRLDSQEKENPNKTTSTLVRLKNTDSTN
ncbi:MAG: hypothetical protein ACKO24_01865, partial [Leptolyngbyaceae cyanobacterium]